MKNEQSLTIKVPPAIHEAFRTKCFLEKPHRSMTDRILDFMADECGLPRPKRIDRRKLTHKQREELDKQEAKTRRAK